MGGSPAAAPVGQFVAHQRVRCKEKTTTTLRPHRRPRLTRQRLPLLQREPGRVGMTTVLLEAMTRLLALPSPQERVVETVVHLTRCQPPLLSRVWHCPLWDWRDGTGSLA